MKATMKRAFLLILAILAVATLAAVPHYDRRSIDLPDGAYWQDDKTVILPPEPTHSQPFSAEKGFDNVDTGSIADTDNATAAVLGKRKDFAPDEWRIDIRTGGPEQHIGTLGKDRLFKKLYQAIKYLGTPVSKGCREGHEFCKDSSACCASSFRIDNIVYNSGGDTYATNAHLSVKLWWSEIYDDAHKGLRHVAYDLAAMTFVKSVEQEENCYYVNFKNSRKTRMCNVPRHVLIIIPSNGADRNIQARLNVVVDFSGSSAEGEYHCEKTLPRITKYFKEASKPEIAKVMDWNSDKIFLYNSCQEDKCFDTRERYNLGAPWVEPKGCNPPKDFD